MTTILAHGSKPRSWGPLPAGDAYTKLFELWADGAMPEVGTAWEMVADGAPAKAFTVWRQDYDANRQWRVAWPSLTHEDAIADALDRADTRPPAPHSPQRVLVLPEGAPAPPREPAYAVEVRSRTLGHAGWEKVLTGLTARGAEDIVRQLRARPAPGWEGSEVRSRLLEPFQVRPGHRYRVVRPDRSVLHGGRGAGRWEYGEIGIAAPNDSDKYDAQVMLIRAMEPPVRKGASFLERMDARDPLFYFYTDDIEPADSSSSVEAEEPRIWTVVVGEELTVVEDPSTGLVVVGKAKGPLDWKAFIPSGAREPIPSSMRAKSVADVSKRIVWSGKFLPSGALREISASWRGKKLEDLLACIEAGDPLHRQAHAGTRGASPMRTGASMTSREMVAHDAAVMEGRGRWKRGRKPS